MTTRPLDQDPLVLVLVGKPARGKSYTARKVAGYLTWLGYRARVFNVGAYRRERLGAGQDHTFFDPSNPAGVQARRDMASAAMTDMLAWIEQGGEVALYDATNSTRERRSWVRDRCSAADLKAVFVELVCEDDEIITANVRATKITSPDYAGRDPEDAVADFRRRLAHYEAAYQPVTEEDGSYVRLIDAGRKVELHRVQDYLSGRIVTFLMNLHLGPRPIYFTRHGESTYNVAGRIGGDSRLSPLGKSYAAALTDFVHKRFEDSTLRVWTSTLARTIETASHLDFPQRSWRVLDEIDAGICDGLSYLEIEAHMPDEFEARQADKFRYRYPRGESYEDVITRLDAAVIELERAREPVLVVAHQAVLRALYSYFKQIDPQTCPFLPIPLHTVIELTPTAYGCEERRLALGPGTEGPR